MKNPSTEISRIQTIAYALPALALSLMGVTYFVYMPKFYSDLGLLSLEAVGSIVLISRIWDAVTDPLIGRLSDKTLSKLGRRRPWLIFSLLPLSLLFLAVLNPSWNTFTTPYTWFLSTSLLFYLFWTTFAIPYEALGAELSMDYNHRTRILSTREAALVFGTLLAAVIPFASEHYNFFINTEQQWTILSIAYGILLVISGLWCFSSINEKSWSIEKKSQDAALISIKKIFHNSPFCILLSSYAISAFGAALPATLILFYVEHVLKSTNASAYLILYFVIGLLFLPLWNKIASKIGKKHAWLSAMSISTIAFLGVFFLKSGDEFIYAILVSISGIGYGASLALPSSMQADVIDYEEMRTGKRKEGQFLGIWSLAKKTTSAIGAGVGLWILGYTGYDPVQTTQTPLVLSTLSALYALVPSLCNIAAILLALKYPIDEKYHLEIRNKIDQMSVGT